MQGAGHPWRIAARDLACRRGDRLLFRGLSIDLRAGAALQVAGANGIGKSSLLRILAGLMPAYAGSVEREGAVGLVDERPALDPHQPLGRALGFWAGFDGLDTPSRDAICDLLDLAPLFDVPVRYLSTGQKKRAALARLLAQGAPVWLLDEPLNGLDVAAVAMVEELIASHCAGGGIALVASHQAISLPDAARIELAAFAA